MRVFPLLFACSLVACSKASQAPAPGGSPAPSVSNVSTTGNSAPSTFVRTTAEQPAMRSIDVRDGLAHPQLMRTLVEALSQRYVVDVTDPRAGFAMTTWQASGVRDGVPDLRYRTRITARFVDDWHSLQVLSEARWARGGQEADIGYDSVQLDSVTTDLRAKLGKKQP